MDLSIIVPFYNVEKYIGFCLDSLLDQNIDDYEIICVNDCSTDSSRNIVLDYIDKFPNILLIEHSDNKKVGGARNTGFNAAKGEYIWFVDSDDFILHNCLSLLINTSKENDLDVLAFNIQKVSDNGILIQKEPVFNDYTEKPIIGVDFLRNTFSSQLIYNLGYPYRALYKRKLLKRINAVFPENVSYGEETVYMVRSIIYAKRTMSFSDAFYCYRQNPTSVTNKLEVNFKGELVFQSIINAGNYVNDLIDECKSIDKNIASVLIDGMPWFVNRLLPRLLKTSYNERKVFFKLCKSNNKLVHRIAHYFNFYNRFIFKNCYLSGVIICFMIPFYKLKKYWINRRCKPQ